VKTPFDLAVLGIVALTVLVAAWRGFVREAIALASWFVAFWAALAFVGAGEALLSGVISEPRVRSVVAFAAVFLAVLVATGLAGRALSKLVHLAGLGLVDRFLGAAFGLAKGSIVVLVLVLLAGLTPLPQQPWWRDSELGAPLASLALALRPWLPEAIAGRLHYPGTLDARPSPGGAARADRGDEV
jgi:membrane protein required for colicin V production